MKLLRKYIREKLIKENVLATGMCFPFAYQKAEEWFEKYYTKGRPGRSAKKHPDLNDKSKFKVVHGTVTNKWKSPPKPVVHGWVEMGDLVFDDQTRVTKPNGIEKEVYYDMYQPEVYKEFTAEEAILNCAMKGGEGPWDDDLYAQLQQRDEWLQEKAQRGKGKNKRTLYHINKRPATPQPKVKMLQDWDPKAIDRDTGEKTGDMVDIPGTDNWQRHWLDSPVKSGVFLTPNPADIAMKHGRSGNVYAYKVPEWVIDKSGGLHRYDSGSEVLIPEDVWNEAGDEIEFLGKSMDQKQLWDKTDQSMYGRGQTRKAKEPSWMSDEELKKWETSKDAFNLPALRATKHPESAVKMMKPDEVKKALAAFEKVYEEKPAEIIPPPPGDRKGIKIPHFGHKPSLQDQKLIDMLKKRQNESLIREYMRALLKEDPMGFVQDLAAASDEFGEEGEMFFGGNPGKGGGKAIKRAFNANADHTWLATLNTIHWKDPYILDQLQDASKDELSTSMSLPGESLLKSQFGDVGLWIKGRITLATNDQDNLYSGNLQDYKPKGGLDDVDMEALRKYLHKKDSSGINKLPQVSKDYSRYGNLKPGNDYSEKLARSIPYVLDQSTWDPDQTYSSTNEALVDNWKAIGIVVGTEDLLKSVKAAVGSDWARDAIGVTRKIFKLADDYGVPIYDVNRTKLWSPDEAS